MSTRRAPARNAFALVGPLLIMALGIPLTGSGTRAAQFARVIWNDLHQTIDGFGGSCADFSDPLTPAQADFFYTTAGLGFTILRTQIIPDRATCDAEFHQAGCSEANGQILNGELRSAQMAVARGATVFSSPWSPPGAYKSNGSFKNGGYLLPSHYSDWASGIASYVVMMQSKGVPIFAVSVQNEPNISIDYGSCLYSAKQIHDFVPYLHSALQSAGAGATKIIIAEESTWSFGLAASALADPQVAQHVGIVAAHAYAGDPRPFLPGNRRLWQTEGSGQSPTYDGSMKDALGWARKIHAYLVTANVNAWVWWFLTDMPRQGEGTDNAALTDIDGNYPKRAYVTGQWSRFVRPGWVRIGAHSSGPVLLSAFKDQAGGSFAIVAVNTSRFPVLQTISLEGFAADPVTPWITSASLSLAREAPLPLDRGRFTVEIPPSSVVTFTGKAVPSS